MLSELFCSPCEGHVGWEVILTITKVSQLTVSEGRVTRVIPGDGAISLISGGFLVLKAVDSTDIASKTVRRVTRVTH